MELQDSESVSQARMHSREHLMTLNAMAKGGKIDFTMAMFRVTFFPASFLVGS